MLEYEWSNPSTIILSGHDGGAATESDETRRQFLDHNNYTFVPDHYLRQPRHVPYTPATTGFSRNHYNHVFDTRAFTGASPTSFSHLPSSSLFSLDPIPPVNASHCGLGPQYVGRPVDFVGRGLGLKLGGRTYFATSNDNLVNRLYRGSKAVEPGSANSPRCQAEGCNADLSDAKHYHRRHKVCEFHSKASTVVAGGLTQRFCQQCSRFHLLSEFDNGKRSCRRRLADHNRRRRKLQQATQEIQKSHLTLDNVTSSSPDSRNDQSSPAVLVKVSPPDYFRQKPYRIRDSSTTSGLSFFSNE